MSYPENFPHPNVSDLQENPREYGGAGILITATGGKTFTEPYTLGIVYDAMEGGKTFTFVPPVEFLPGDELATECTLKDGRTVSLRAWKNGQWLNVEEQGAG